jgi:hypothetical protein
MMKNVRDEQEQETMVSLTPQLVFYSFFSFNLKLQISCKEQEKEMFHVSC